MIFDGTLGISTILNLGVILIGLIVAWVTLKHKQETSTYRLDDLSKEVERANAKMAKIELSLATDFVSKPMLREFEERFIERITEQNNVLNKNIDELKEEFKQIRGILLSRNN